MTAKDQLKIEALEFGSLLLKLLPEFIALLDECPADKNEDVFFQEKVEFRKMYHRITHHLEKQKSNGQ